MGLSLFVVLCLVDFFFVFFYLPLWADKNGAMPGGA